MNERTYKAYVQILEDELIVATGCTEPIAIAFASAKAAQVLGSEHIHFRQREHYQERP